MKNRLKLSCLWVLAVVGATACANVSVPDDVCRFVNPFVGTTANSMGHCTPAAAWPFGMAQAAPATGRQSSRYCAQYVYEDDVFFGFTQNILAGTGVPDLGDVLILPVSGPKCSYRLKADKSSERAEPGYYAIRFADEGIGVEATIAEHSAIYAFDYSKAKGAVLYIDLQWGCGGGRFEDRVEECETHFADDGLVTGHMKVCGWVDRDVFFALRASCSFRKEQGTGNREQETENIGKGEKWLLTFEGEPKTVLVKIALSAVSEEGASRNLDTEMPDWDFARVRAAARAEWNRWLSRIAIDGTDDDKAKFYTALYRTMVQPNNLADVDGQCRTAKGEVVKSSGGRFFSTFSLWDTYRAAHPLYTLVAPEKVPEFVNSMLDQYDALGHLPMWGLWGKDAECMLGIHSVSVIADAMLKGLEGFDCERAYEAVRTTQRVSHILPKEKRRKFFHLRDEWEVLDKYGYYPFDVIQGESVSRVMENSYDDWCAAQMARKLLELFTNRNCHNCSQITNVNMGESRFVATSESLKSDAEFFERRCRAYRNIYDPSTGMMRGRDAAGNWREPFDPYEVGHSSEPSTGMNDYTEGNAYQWAWHVLHDPQDVARLMGGPDKFKSRLKELFELPDVVRGPCKSKDVTSLIGQYAHGNEPSHHVMYLFDLTDEPWRGQVLIRQVCSRMYRDEPDGLPGNDDCGQMSAWYVFAALGFYPVSPASGEYWIGAPQVPKATLRLRNSTRSTCSTRLNTFTVIARNLSKENKYVKSVTLNGKTLDGFTIRHSDIMRGGELVFEMTSCPCLFAQDFVQCSHDYDDYKQTEVK